MGKRGVQGMAELDMGLIHAVPAQVREIEIPQCA